MKISVFSFCVLGLLCTLSFAAQYYGQANSNSLPCTTEQMVNLTNRARSDRNWMMSLINASYPESAYPQYPAETNTSKTLYYVQTVRTYLMNTSFPVFVDLLTHDGINLPAGMHAHQMANYDYFAHEGCCDSSPDARMRKYTTYQSTGENLWTSWSTPGYESWTCEQVLVDLIVDTNVPSLGHRLNTYRSMWTHVGVGFGGGVSGGWAKYYVAFDFGGKPGQYDANMLSAGIANRWLDHYVQNVVCLNNEIFAGKNGVKVVVANCTATTTTTDAAAKTTTTDTNNTTSVATTTTTTSVATTTTTTVATTTTTATTTNTTTSDPQVAADGTCYGSFAASLIANATNFRTQATSATTANMLTALKAKYPGFFSPNPVSTFTAANLPALTLSTSLSKYACDFARSQLTGSQTPAQPNGSYLYYVTGSVVKTKVDYQTLTILQGVDNFYSKAFASYGFAVYTTSTNAVVVGVLGLAGI